MMINKLSASSWLLLSVLLIQSTILVQAQTEQDVANNPFNFHLFENFDVTRDVYAKEHLLVKKLLRIKEILKKQEQLLTSYLDKKKSLRTLQTDLSKDDFVEVKDTATSMIALTKEFPTEIDKDGAVRGIMKLQRTYLLNLTALSSNRRLEYVNPHNQKISFACHETFRAMDYAVLAQTSFDKFYYATAVDFLKVGLSLAPLEKGQSYAPTKSQLKLMDTLRKHVVKFNNDYLIKRETNAGPGFYVKPYLITEKLNKKKKQPKFVQENRFRITPNLDELFTEHIFGDVCRTGRGIGPKKRIVYTKELTCRLLHHQDPYLKLGPFKEEQVSEVPYVIIFHDILSDLEMDFLIDESRPKLSRTRDLTARRDYTPVSHKSEFKHDKKKRKIVSKSVQYWIIEANFTKSGQDFFDYQGDDYKNINYPIAWNLTKKIGLATNFKTHGHYSGTGMQITNYGLGGLCEGHIDPHGYIEGTKVPPSRESLKVTGDMIGTFMGWLNNVEAGGGTAYFEPGHEGVVIPERGSAAFWYDLDAKSHRDILSSHGGCPILKGSKWILNKWIFSFDQFDRHPCHLTPRGYITPPATSAYL